jgi:hypothetical protein
LKEQARNSGREHHTVGVLAERHRKRPSPRSHQNGRKTANGGEQVPEPLKTRVRGEFLEMPGLCLTLGQACRLWDMSATDCRAVLDELITEGFLSRTPNGSYIALPPSRSRHHLPRSARRSG